MSTGSDLRRAMRRLDEMESKIRRLWDETAHHEFLIAGIVAMQLNHAAAINDIIAVLDMILEKIGPFEDAEAALRCARLRSGDSRHLASAAVEGGSGRTSAGEPGSVAPGGPCSYN